MQRIQNRRLAAGRLTLAHRNNYFQPLLARGAQDGFQPKVIIETFVSYLLARYESRRLRNLYYICIESCLLQSQGLSTLIFAASILFTLRVTNINRAEGCFETNSEMTQVSKRYFIARPLPAVNSYREPCQYLPAEKCGRIR